MKKKYVFRIILVSLILISGILGSGLVKQNERKLLADFYQSELVRYEQLTSTDVKAAKADQPDMAALQNYFMCVDPELERVPSERLSDAYHYATSLKSDLRSVTDIDWTIIGSNMGGRTKAIMWDPNDPEHKKAWAGGVSGGLWFNEDLPGNGEWVMVDDFWPSLSVHDICYDPNDTETYYIGTGEYETSRVIYRESSSVGIGIWKSEDAGVSWQLIPSTSEFKYISDIQVVDEDGSSVIYAGVVSGTYHGVNHESEDGLYRSTDGGESWEQVLPNIPGYDVAFAPADIEVAGNGRIFIGTMKNLNANGGATILYSDLGTSGSWTIFDDYEEIIENNSGYYTVPGRVKVVSAPSDPEIVYAIVGAGYYGSGTNFNYAKGEYVLRSADGGENWIEVNLPGGSRDWASLSWHAFVVSVNPADPDEVYVGGLDVWKTENGGLNWNHVSDWSLMYYGGGDEYVHGDIHTQVYRPGTNDEMLLSTDGGVFYTNNSTSSNVVFQEKNDNYGTLQFYTCDIHPQPGNNMFVGGLQDNGTLLYTGTPLDINDMITGGDGAYCFFDDDQEVLITSTYYNKWYSFEDWDYYDYIDAESGVFVNPTDIDEANDRLFANAVEFSGAGGNKILRIEGLPDLYNYEHVILDTYAYGYFSAVVCSDYAPAGTSTLFLGTETGQLYKVTNAHDDPEVEEIGSDDFPAAYISSVAVGGSEDTLCVTFSNYGVSKIWQSYDGGASWSDITNNIPDMPVRWVAYHPDNSLQMMLATEIGVWTTSNGHLPDFSWEIDPVFPMVRVDMLQLREADNTVLAATHGRGLIYGEWPYIAPNSIRENSNWITMQIYPNPSNGILNLTVEIETEVEIMNSQGVLVRKSKIYPGTNQIILNNLSKGIYYIRMNENGETHTEKIIIQ